MRAFAGGAVQVYAYSGSQKGYVRYRTASVDGRRPSSRTSRTSPAAALSSAVRS
ncbi:hypothetical protein [Streptomyces sp. NPDC005322]|uniref:hypothetical protein n=1 Tax=unclassified Streptomyces TaxID=2593676 RepID=UPI0033B6DDBD